MTSKITIQTVAAVDDAVKGLDKVNSSIDQLGKGGTKASDKLRTSFTEIKSAIDLGKTALDSLRQAWDFGKEGAQVARLRDSFEMLGKSEADLNKLRQASLGTVDDYNLMLSTNRAKLLGVSTETNQLAKLLQVAAVRGRAMGLDTTQAFNDIVTGIGRASPLILDNLGIVTGGEKTYADFAKSIGKSADALTDAEKRQALFNKVLKESESLGPLIADTATKFERAEAKITNATNAVKEFAAQGFDALFLISGEGTQQLIDAFDASAKQIRADLIDGRMTLDQYNSAIRGMADSVGKWDQAIGAALNTQAQLTQAQLDGLQATDRAVKITDSIDRSLRRAAEGNKKLQQAAAETANWIQTEEAAMATAATFTDGWRESVDLLSASQKELTTEILFQQAAKGLDEASAIKLGEAMGLISSANVDLLSKLQQTKAQYDANRDGLISASEASRGYYSAVLDLNRAIADLPANKEIRVTVVMDETGATPLGGGRAAGGPVYAGQSYTVGERGPETLVMGQGAGYVIPNTTNNYSATFNVNGASDPASIAAYIDKHLGRQSDYRTRTR